ncbi:MAG: S-adenosylmethionine:tRNA ribosyltransferase-isomerase [Bacteroidota bacterium]|nr:S-adenosylmethionine:tRNA ribosyltransferase-isomerase [Bacteroidota bacterium]MDP4211257.1 S-adenosylmethionine:tRNA ribosyltransferase-isomerase [Bacteroidota bacterium]MDP4250423.1 S-adenosylmethionine:tRNA ribosyltransferase-isomerase [Bacteroidota bacterium]
MTIPESFPAQLSMREFQYLLPEEKIARYPLARRDASKLLVWQPDKIRETQFAQIADYLSSKSLLVFNDSKVIAARLIFSKPTGAEIEIFCLEPMDPVTGFHQAMTEKEKGRWKCLIGGASKWKKGTILERKTAQLVLHAQFIEKKTDYFVVEFTWLPASLPFAEVLHLLGSIPLPPYLKRHAEATDEERYQTIYATEEGSVAAPTAGLHFSTGVFQSLKQKQIDQLHITLHVGAGTFMPVKSEFLRDHIMHEEFIEIRADRLEQLSDKLQDPVLAVGTTSLRTVESLYWLGLKVAADKQITAAELTLNQWDAYRMEDLITVKDSLQCLLEWVGKQPEKKIMTRTQLFIVPGYRFKIIRGLITNFHQPQSTLLLLVAALIGAAWKEVYQFALEKDYRFLSYGDGCLFLPYEGNLHSK